MPTHSSWIVCESSGRWAAALRLAISRRATFSSSAPRIYEVRSLAELTAASNEHPNNLALIEVRREDLAEVLVFLAKLRSQHAGRLVALLDQSLSQREAVAGRPPHDNRQLVIEALWEAGAADVVESPRRLQGLLALGQRHAILGASAGEASAEFLSITERAWAALPWQDA